MKTAKPGQQIRQGDILLVRFTSSQVSVEEGTAVVLRHLLDHGTLIKSLSRGRSLEQRFLELT